MDKLKMHSPNLTDENIARIRELFPACVTEATDENGKLRYAVDFDQLRQELSDHIVDGPQERYRLDWPGKRKALLSSNAPLTKTLRPYRAESINFQVTRNLFIEGDNLEVLKLLRESYLGQVAMIYIDPPYNSGNDFIYSDNFDIDTLNYGLASGYHDEQGGRLVSNPESNGRYHSDWLSMMYARLKVSHSFLKDSGLICIHIDDNEIDNLRKLCNEIFGEENFVSLVTVKTKVGGVSGSSEGKSLKDVTEFIWVYAKNKEVLSLNPVYIKTKLSDRIRDYEAEGKSWKYTSIISKLGDKVLLKNDKERKMRFYGYQTLGDCQDSCRLFWLHVACFAASFSGFSHTCSGRLQLRVDPDQRAGFCRRAA